MEKFCDTSTQYCKFFLNKLLLGKRFEQFSCRQKTPEKSRKDLKFAQKLFAIALRYFLDEPVFDLILEAWNMTKILSTLSKGTFFNKMQNYSEFSRNFFIANKFQGNKSVDNKAHKIFFSDTKYWKSRSVLIYRFSCIKIERSLHTME